jgi:hypothetical protein|tara:strand:+ start:6965 stop:7159 length:195 start_codon:yes stop_codon:yes gene_type:complete
MARWEKTHIINNNFAFGDPVVQYKKGSEARLNGDCAKFAENTGSATALNPAKHIFDDNSSFVKE